jgi:N-glycosylase/DNA lyase
MKILTGDINKDYEILRNFTRYLKELQTKDINYFYAHYLKNYIYINKIKKEVDAHRLRKILHRIDDLCYQEYLLAEINDYKNSEKNNISYNGKVERYKNSTKDRFVLKEKYCNDF